MIADSLKRSLSRRCRECVLSGSFVVKHDVLLHNPSVDRAQERGDVIRSPSSTSSIDGIVLEPQDVRSHETKKGISGHIAKANATIISVCSIIIFIIFTILIQKCLENGGIKTSSTSTTDGRSNGQQKENSTGDSSSLSIESRRKSTGDSSSLSIQSRTMSTGDSSSLSIESRRKSTGDLSKTHPKNIYSYLPNQTSQEQRQRGDRAMIWLQKLCYQDSKVETKKDLPHYIEKQRREYLRLRGLKDSELLSQDWSEERKNQYRMDKKTIEKDLDRWVAAYGDFNSQSLPLQRMVQRILETWVANNISNEGYCQEQGHLLSVLMVVLLLGANCTNLQDENFDELPLVKSVEADCYWAFDGLMSLWYEPNAIREGQYGDTFNLRGVLEKVNPDLHNNLCLQGEAECYPEYQNMLLRHVALWLASELSFSHTVLLWDKYFEMTSDDIIEFNRWVCATYLTMFEVPDTFETASINFSTNFKNQSENWTDDEFFKMVTTAENLYKEMKALGSDYVMVAPNLGEGPVTPSSSIDSTSSSIGSEISENDFSLDSSSTQFEIIEMPRA